MANAIPGVKALRMAVIMAACAAPYDPLLPHRPLLERYDWWDNRDWDWYAEKIPFFESPDSLLDATYYYRWEVLTKHLTCTRPGSATA